jgi:hypothetical protein
MNGLLLICPTNRRFRCEASNSANALRPVTTRIHFNVFFEPRKLRIELERPEVGDRKYDRARAFKNERKFKDDTYRITMGGELIRLVCVAGIEEMGGKE